MPDSISPDAPLGQSRRNRAAGHERNPGAASRAASAFAVQAVQEGQSLSEALPKFCEGFGDLDRALIQEIAYGTLRHRRYLGLTLNAYLKQSITQRNAIVRSLLLCGLYQLSFMRTPIHAVVSSCVDATHLCRCAGLSGLVNAVLRRFIRENRQLIQPSSPAEEHSFPDWLHKRLEAAYPGRAATIMAASNEQPPLWLRVETSKTTADDLCRRFWADGIECEKSPLLPCAVKVLKPRSVNELPGFTQGLFAVQDLSAQMAAGLLDLADGQRVLDCCCAPGGKSAHILDVARVDLTCVDGNAQRLAQAQARLTALGRKVRALCLDMRAENPGLGLYDRVLLDAPCSGTGVIRRHPDIKWLRRDKDIASLAKTQSELIKAAFRHLKPGGLMLYATCSILPDENRAVVESFIGQTPQAALLPDSCSAHGKPGLGQRLPGQDGGDGFFYALIAKRGDGPV